MITNDSIISQNLEYLSQFSFSLIKEHFRELCNDFILEMSNYEEFWKLNRRYIKRNYRRFYDITNYDPKLLFANFLRNHIDDEFNKFMNISSRFIDLLRKDSIFNDYFNWLKKYILSFLKANNINHIHGDCLVETDIEDPSTEEIKIKFFLPIEDFDKILDLMELFLIEQEIFLNESTEDYYFMKLIIQKFKRTYFIFRPMF